MTEKIIKHKEHSALNFLSIGKTLFVFSVLIEFLLALGHIWVTWFPELEHHKRLIQFFHLDREGNLPTWFSSTQFLVLAFVFIALYLQDRYRQIRKLWLVCATAAIFLSFDEASAFHELLGTGLDLVFDTAPRGSWLNDLAYFPSYYWILIYVPVALPLAFIMFRFLARELQGEFRSVLIGAVIFAFGAIVLDFLEGYYGTPNHKGVKIGTGNDAMLLDTALAEEFMEMFGISFIIYAFIRHYAKIRAVSNAPP